MKEKYGTQAMVVTALFTLGLMLVALLLLCGVQLSRMQSTAVLGLPALGQSTTRAEGEEGLSTTDIVALVSPSVVSVDLYKSGAISPHSSGSGVVLSADGYIATNAHVVYGEARIRVVLADGQGYPARLVGCDLNSDLAVLKVTAKGLVPAGFADSNEVVVGQRVVAIGNANGTLPGSTSQGIISGVGRNMPLSTALGEVVRMNLLQTDAAINPGSSGGALADQNGRVVGINIGKIEDSNVENIGFAIPSALAVPVLQSIIDGEQQAARALLGVAVTQLNETTGPPKGLPEEGLYISELTAQSELAALGVQAGDALVEAEGQPLRTVEDLLVLLEKYKPGQTITVKVFSRQSGLVQAFAVTLYEGE